MKKALAFVVSASGLIGNVYAQGSVTLYGAIDTGISYVSNAATTKGHSSNVGSGANPKPATYGKTRQKPGCTEVNNAIS